MPDEQKKDELPEEFGEVADDSVEASIADEVAGYDQAIERGSENKPVDTPSADKMGDFA